jgi:hypothetical protein
MKANAITEINKAIISALSAYKVYNESAPDDAVYPFITFEVTNTTLDAESTEIVYLDIDGWDNYTEANNTTRLETIMSGIASILQNKIVSIDGLSFSFFLESRKTIKDTDLNIRRRKQQYQVRTIGKE